jgi:hypothetical protein
MLSLYDVEDLSMRLKPIKNNRDYQKGLKEINRLMMHSLTPQKAIVSRCLRPWRKPGKRWHIDEPEPVETNACPKSRPSVSDW